MEHLDTVEVLLERQDVKAGSMDRSGQTALSPEAGQGRVEVMNLLLERDDVKAD